MATYFLGQIIIAGFNFAPKNFALCNGQLLAINQNTALFSLLGTNFGGNGTTTFGLPNLQSQVPIHQGQGQGLSNYPLGSSGGVPNVTIDQSTCPHHTHSLSATTANATSTAIGNTLLPGKPTATNGELYAVNSNPPLTFDQMNAGAVSVQGQNQPHTNLMPSLCVTFCICIAGVYPSRN
jgi:microcystin-dependent protein